MLSEMLMMFGVVAIGWWALFSLYKLAIWTFQIWPPK